MAACKTCDAPMIWAKNEQTGRWMPLDKWPDTGGTWEIDTAGIEPVAVKRDPANLDGRPLHKAHWSTCPDADHHRNPR